MNKAHRIRLHPTPEQATYFARAAGVARFVYNWALAEWKRHYEAYQAVKEGRACSWPKEADLPKSPSALSLKKQFNSIKREQFPWVLDVTKCASEQAFADLGKAFTNFFKKRAWYPQFKSKKRSRASFYVSNDTFTVGDHWIKLPHIGKVNMAERLRFRGKILSVRITRSADWWFASISVEVPDTAPLPTLRPAIGIDVGINRLATCSDGQLFENQKVLSTRLKQLRRANQRLHARKKGSANREKARRQVARLHYRIACLREDVLHKLTTAVAEQCAFVGREDLHIKGLLKNRKLSRALSDAALGRLLTLLENKVVQRGGQLLKVDRFFPSTQLCHCCGWRWSDIALSDRVFVCQNPDCQWQGDRDFNAAVTILQEALRLLAQMQAKGKAVEESGYRQQR